jgi:hypothetical protein
MRGIRTIVGVLGALLAWVLIFCGLALLSGPTVADGLAGLELLGVGGFLVGAIGFAVYVSEDFLFAFPLAVFNLLAWLVECWVLRKRPEGHKRLPSAYRLASSLTLLFAVAVPWFFLVVGVAGAALYCITLFFAH